MEYNTSREPMIIAEYGRNIQLMIEQLLKIEDRNARTRAAYFIVEVMAQMNPQVKESSDFMHKLWDHLHIISQYKLNIDGPYPAPKPGTLQKRSYKIVYNQHSIQYGHYGHHLEAIIKKAIMLDDGAEKDALVEAIANQMKKLYLSWNHETVNDATIAENLEEMSGGRLTIKENMKIMTVSEIVAKNIGNIPSPQEHKKKKHGGKRGPQSQRSRK